MFVLGSLIILTVILFRRGPLSPELASGLMTLIVLLTLVGAFLRGRPDVQLMLIVLLPLMLLFGWCVGG